VNALLRVAIIGCGLIGRRRAQNLIGAKLVACADIDAGKALGLAQAIPGCVPYDDWQRLLAEVQCDAVIVATLHDTLAEISAAAAQRGRHVLVEKPTARSSLELERLAIAANDTGVRVRVGFNHRYHRSFRKARELVDAGAIGELMFVRSHYGHGGRPGYEREWRADPKRSGGGELIDQGPHVIDLARWFLGEFAHVEGRAHTLYWDMIVDDNAFLLLHTVDRKPAFISVSCSEWKNTFSFQLYGKKGKLDVSGLGGSYGLERIAFYRMLPEMGPPETTVWEFPMADDSWSVEFGEFVEDIRQSRTPSPGLADAAAALRIIDQIYRTSGYDHRP
jgi:predicted dehydrogenase